MVYGRFRRASKSVRSSWGRRRTTRGTRYGAVRKSRFPGRRFAPRFAVVGFARDSEKKYFDKAIYGVSGGLWTRPNDVVGVGMSIALSKSSGWWGAPMPNSPESSPQGASWQGNLLRGLPQGTTATSRVGNVINVKYIKGNITVTANTKRNKTTTLNNGQYGEAVVAPVSTGEDSLVQYVRTTYRVVVVRDLQVNSTSTSGVTWDTVFSSVNGTSGVHSELNVDNMGRFRIMMDRIVNLDADDPQKTIPFLFRNIGRVRSIS